MWGKRCPVCNYPKSKCWCPKLSGCPICGKPFPCLDH